MKELCLRVFKVTFTKQSDKNLIVIGYHCYLLLSAVGSGGLGGDL